VGHGSIEALQAAPVAATRRLSGYDLLFVNMVQPRSKLALSCYAALGAKLILVNHLSVASEDAAAAPSLRRRLSRALDQVTLARVDALVGVSEYVRAREAARFGLPPGRTRVIYNGVDVGRFTTDKTPSASGALRLLCVAQLVPEKGVQVLLRALTLTQTQHFTLKVAGYGRMEGELQALTRELGLADRVEFLGMRDDVHALLREADVFVHPAIWEEAFGLTVTEGMASGCGVIATRGGGIPEIIDDGQDGLLVPRGDAAALARAIDRLAQDPALRARLGAAGRLKVERAFGLARCIREHVDFMEQVAFGRPGAQVRTLPLEGRDGQARASSSRGTGGRPA
jgi:glycosyltransferase involved in cell wall biosynthesis